MKCFKKLLRDLFWNVVDFLIIIIMFKSNLKMLCDNFRGPDLNTNMKKKERDRRFLMTYDLFKQKF